ncbi:zinc finger MYM-type protein 1-like protein [Tanacetum coccineum]
MNKKRTIDSFYKPIKDVVCEPETVTQTQTENQTNGDNIMEESPRARVEPETNTTLNTDEVKLESLIRDPGVRPPLSSYPSNQQDEIRRTYIRLGPYQLVKAHYPLSPCGFHKRRFQAAWFRRFWWLEYSDKKDAAFCFPCYLFGRKPIGRAGSDTFTAKDLKNKVCHIENVIDKQTEQEIMDNRLRLKVTIDSTKWLTLQTCPLRGGDERPTSLNRGNYLELVKLLALYNKDVARVLENAPKNAKYTSPDIQKELLQMFAMKVQEAIRDEIRTAKFCLIVDEYQDESKKEQMAIVVRFVDQNGYNVQDIRGSLTKRNDQLPDAQLAEISHLAEIGELEGGRRANKMKNIQRPGDTRWSSYFKSICSLVRLFGPTRVVLNAICIGRSTGPQKGDAKYALTHLLSFDFVLVLHLMKKIMEITDKLCKFLQNKSQDIVNALTLVSTTKTLIQKLRDDGWQSLIDQVVCFCDKYNIPVPDMSATYRDIIRTRNKKDDVTVEHHYRVDVFIVAIDSQLQELNNRFNESVSELLRLSVTLDPKKSFNADDICKLVTKYYPLDFTEQERIELRLELQHFKLDSDPKLKNVSSLSALCRGLQETEKSEMYPLIDRLIRLILTLPVSTATSERAFSKMKLVKTRLRSTMSDDFLKSSMILSIEREIVSTLCNEKIIDDFYSKSQRRVQMMKKHKLMKKDGSSSAQWYSLQVSVPPVKELRKLMRIQALRCHVIYCQNGKKINVIPVSASRSQALRYLYLRWGMDLSKVVVFVGESGDTDYEGFLGGIHKSVILKGIGSSSNNQLHANRVYPLSDVIPTESANIIQTPEACSSADIRTSLAKLSVLKS